MNDDPIPLKPLPQLRNFVAAGAHDQDLKQWCEDLGAAWASKDAPHERVLAFWFGPAGSSWHPRYRGPSALWFHATEAIDEDILTRFGPLYAAACAGELDTWADTARGALALVLLLDQFPRHMFRGRAQMFATDAAARVFATRALESEYVETLSPPQQAFAWMALEHAEDPEVVARALEGLDALCRDPLTRRSRRFYKNLRRAAQQHLDLLQRFERYPHRNELLGRLDTPTEQAWLAQAQRPRFADSVQGHREVAPLKLLVLHSFRQSASRLRARTKALSASLSSVAELVFIDAPHPYAATGGTRALLEEDFGQDLEDLGDMSHQRCWWNSGSDHSRYAGWEASLAYLARVCAEQGPFDGILGFSQGAAAAGLLAASRAQAGVDLRLVICISGFVSRAEAHQTQMTPGAIDLPSLHIYGENDVLVDGARSQALAACFRDAKVLTHAGGHFVPALWPVAEIRDFLLTHARPATDCSLEERIRYARKHHVAIGLGPAGRRLWESLQTDEAKTQSLEACVLEALREPEDRPRALEDLHVIAWALQRNYRSTSSSAGVLAPMPGDEFYRLYLLCLEHAPETFRPWVAWIPRIGGWKQLTRMAIYAANAPASESTAWLREHIVASFEARLRRDDEAKGPVSDCAIAAPRTQSATQRACGLAGELATRMFPASQRTHSYVAYTRLLARVSKRYRSARAPVPSLRAQRRQRALVWQNPAAEAPISDEVLHPRPVPVKPCPRDELDPLLAHLEHKQGVDEQTRFARGTHMPDGRLDLCKQVVGPDGIAPVLHGLADNPFVTRLMIGNNIVGNTGASAIADFIRSGRSHIETWYIAGNEFDAEGLVPVCEALYDNPHVRSLWLKRNPLGPQSGPLLAQLLRRNHRIHTLDLVNTGLLDAGAQPILEALADNQGLRHLYLGTNGLGPDSARMLSTLLGTHDRLRSLFLSCNRLGDEGVLALAEGLAENHGLERLGLASNRLSPAAAEALSAALAEHPTLRFVDLGWTRATAAVGELGNNIANRGAEALAQLLRHNPRIQALDLSHNRISQTGIDAIAAAVEHSDSLVWLRHPQHGKAVNHDSLARLHARVEQNWARLHKREPTLRRADVTTPRSTQAVLSVYRTSSATS